MAVPLLEIVLLAVSCTVGTGAAAYYALKRLKKAERDQMGDVELGSLHRDDDYREGHFEGQGASGNVFLPQGL